jgi:hypothetical protein
MRSSDHRGRVTLALLIVGLIGGGLRALVGDNPAYDRLLGTLALLAGVTVLAITAAYLHRPARAPDQPTFRTDPDDQVRN